MEQKILKLLARKDYRPSNAHQLVGPLGLRNSELDELEKTLKQLERSGQIVRTKSDRFIISREADLVPGTISINRSGKGFLRPEQEGVKEIVIAENQTGTALHGDRVLVRREVRSKGMRLGPYERASDMHGSVVRILERKRVQLVGTLQRTPQFWYVIPDDPRIPHDIYVPPARDVGRAPIIGDKVVVELREWASRQSNPEGEIIEVLGKPDEEGVDMLSVLRHYNLPLHFPKNVLQEANTIARSRPLGEPTEAEVQDRVDCRRDMVVTIDPDDAKDFDDAICLQPAGDGRWKLWVHIADVSHYVKPGTALDEEGRKRGNSTYLVDRVIPMLPEALSNELCSLKPGVDRLTKAVEFLLSDTGAVLQAKFHQSVIRSQRRFTYKEVFAILSKPRNGDPIERMIHDAHEMAQKIRRARFKAGSLDLDFPENKIRLDAHGRVLFIEKVENDASHQLIEEYMLLANEAVATKLIATRRQAPHRIHEPPNDERLQEYREEVLSHNIPCGNLSHRPEVQKLLAKLGTIPIGNALKIGFLKSLMRARYAVEPIGHYGLAKAKYTHFTSPIRRYADLLVHRALFDRNSATGFALKTVTDHISETERNSADAERDSKDVKLFAFLKAQLKDGPLHKYNALVTDVRNFGFFVDVSDLGMSGLVHLSSMHDDFFVFDSTRNHLVGRRSRRVIKLGDRLVVQVCKVDSYKKQVDFELAREVNKEVRSRDLKQGGRDVKPANRDLKQSRPEQKQGRKRRDH
jgi:ribonuclease R